MDEDKETDEVELSTEEEVSTAKEGVSTDFEKVSTDRPKLSTAKDERLIKKMNEKRGGLSKSEVIKEDTK
ncbi:hypothetical protein Tco_0663713, partial [Tanacetum coccineum]